MRIFQLKQIVLQTLAQYHDMYCSDFLYILYDNIRIFFFQNYF